MSMGPGSTWEGGGFPDELVAGSPVISMLCPCPLQSVTKITAICLCRFGECNVALRFVSFGYNVQFILERKKIIDKDFLLSQYPYPIAHTPRRPMLGASKGWIVDLFSHDSAFSVHMCTDSTWN